MEAIKGLHFTDMSTQPAAVLASARLGSRIQRTASARNYGHWYTGTRHEHSRPDAVDLFHDYFAAAKTAGLRVEDYVPPPVFA